MYIDPMCTFCSFARKFVLGFGYRCGMVNYPSVVEWRGRLSSIVRLVLLLLAKLERGIDNYPLILEDW